jgi:hypothetical protein
MAARLEPLSPLRALEVRMDKSARPPFVVQMRKFGSAFGFTVLVRQDKPDPDDLFFVMRRHDVDLLSANDSDTGAPDLKFGVGFYPKRGQPPPSLEVIKPLVEGLKLYLAEVPGAIVREK